LCRRVARAGPPMTVGPRVFTPVPTDRERLEQRLGVTTDVQEARALRRAEPLLTDHLGIDENPANCHDWSTMKRDKLIPYVRQSRTRERSISVDEQLRAIQAWAEANDVELLEPVIERSTSGAKPWKERELGKAIEACEQREASGIIVAFQDRLSRENGLATSEVWAALDKAGARLVAASEGLDTAAGDQELLFTIKAAIAREQWKRFSKNFADAKRNAVERGVHIAGTVPVGYLRGKDGKLVLDAKRAPAIAEAFKLRAGGASLGTVAAMLDKRIRRGISGKGSWHHQALSKVLANPVYTGQARQGAHVKEGAHPAIVTRRIFDLCAAVATARAQSDKGQRGSQPQSLLAGLVRCASCGYALTRTTAGGKYRVYRCNGKNCAGVKCAAPATCMESQLDALVEGIATAQLLKLREAHEAEAREVLVGLPCSDDPDVEAAQAALDDARATVEALLPPEIAKAYGPARFAAALAEADEAVEIAEATLAEAVGTGGDDGVWVAVFPIDEWEWLDKDAKRAAIARVVERVTVARAPRGTELADRVEIALRSEPGRKAKVVSLAAKRAAQKVAA
jgi:DNA invertase Pin-like site-specific DNA recombinase